MLKICFEVIIFVLIRCVFVCFLMYLLSVDWRKIIIIFYLGSYVCICFDIIYFLEKEFICKFIYKFRFRLIFNC